MSNIVINGTTYNGIESITVKDTAGSDVKYTKGDRPSGTIEITENGVHDVTNYESANVNVQSDLIDVDALPTENIEDDKVYRSTRSVGMYYVYTDSVMSLSDFFSSIGITLKIEQIMVDSIDEVTNPIIDDTILYIYTDTSSYIGYVFVDETTRLTISEFLNSVGIGVAFSDKGKVDSISQMSEAGGVYYFADIIITIGVPNSENNKEFYEYTGTEWIKYNPITNEYLAGLWKGGRNSNGVYIFTSDGSATFKDFDGNEVWVDGYTFVANKSLINMKDNVDGYSFSCRFVVTNGIPTLVRTDNNTVIFTRVVEYPISTT